MCGCARTAALDAPPTHFTVALLWLCASCAPALATTDHLTSSAGFIPAVGGVGYGQQGYGGYVDGQGVNALQSGYGNGGFGKGFGAYGNYGANRALAGGAYGRGGYADNAVADFGNQGLHHGAVDNAAAHGVLGQAGQQGYNNQGAVSQSFGNKGAARDQFNAGRNKVFSKEKVYAVDQSFQNGNRDAFNDGYGNLGGFNGQGAFGRQEQVRQFGNQRHGAFNGIGQGNYGRFGRQGFGDGVQAINNYGQDAGYAAQGHHGRDFGGYGHGGVGTYGAYGAANRGYGGVGYGTHVGGVAPVAFYP